MAEEPLSAEEFSASMGALTSAFGDPTRRSIYLFAREHPAGVTCAEVAERFTLHRNVARHHLDKLVGGCHLQVELARSESAGRPSKRYRVPGDGALPAVSPGREGVLSGLLVRALGLLPAAQAGALAEEVGYEYGCELAATMGPPAPGKRSIPGALGAVAEALTAHGFAAHTEEREGGLAVVAEHCPFGETARQFPHVACAIDRGMIRGMLTVLHGATELHFAASRPAGDDRCVACL